MHYRTIFLLTFCALIFSGCTAGQYFTEDMSAGKRVAATAYAPIGIFEESIFIATCKMGIEPVNPKLKCGQHAYLPSENIEEDEQTQEFLDNLDLSDCFNEEPSPL